MKVGELMQKSIQNLRKTNKEKVLKVLYELGQCQKSQIVELTSLSSGTCHNILQELIESKEVVMNSKFASTGGRKAKCYELNPDYCQLLTISFFREYDDIYDIMKVYDYQNHLLEEKKSQPKKLNFQELLNNIHSMFEKYQNIQVIMIAIPAILNEQGYLDESFLVRGLEDLKNRQIQQEIQAQFHVPVIIDNDVNIATKGYYSKHQEYKDLAMIYQPLKELSGVGILQGGHIHSGHHGMAGELSFLPGLSKQQQFEYLKTKEGTLQLLTIFILTLLVTVDPETIVISCPWIKESQKIEENLQKTMLSKEVLPHIVVVEDILKYMNLGLLELGHEFLRGGRNNGKIY